MILIELIACLFLLLVLVYVEIYLLLYLYVIIRYRKEWFQAMKLIQLGTQDVSSFNRSTKHYYLKGNLRMVARGGLLTECRMVYSISHKPLYFLGKCWEL